MAPFDTTTIRDYLMIDHMIIILLDIPHESQQIQNIFCFSMDGAKKWQVESSKKKYHLNREYPYEQMTFINNQLYGIDFYGRRFLIDVKTGSLLDFKVGK